MTPVSTRFAPSEFAPVLVSFAELRAARALRAISEQLDTELAAAIAEWDADRRRFAAAIHAVCVAEAMPCDCAWPGDAA